MIPWRVSATRSPLPSIEFATLRVKDAVCDRFRADVNARPSIDKRAPDVRVHAYLTERDATIYLDTSGEPLFKRGYRRDAEEAPLRENLAAGIVALTGWKPGTPFLDPIALPVAEKVWIETRAAHGAEVAAGLSRQGHFSARVPVARGKNAVLIRARTTDGAVHERRFAFTVDGALLPGPGARQRKNVEMRPSQEPTP